MLRGVTKSQEVAASQLIRDTRPLGEKLADFFREPGKAAITTICLMALMLVYSPLAKLCFLIALSIFLYTMSRPQILPVRLPQRAGMRDFNDINPGTKKPNKARGITFFGNDRETGEEIWFSNDDMRTHVLIFGSTGSGKTEALLSIGFNSLVQGSGLIYVDGKGDNSLWAKIFSMARQMGREDDLLVVNFMTGARDIIGPQKDRLSNTMNPFCQGSSSMLAQLVTSLMDGSGGGDGDMWKGRAISFVEALMKLLVYMRDKNFILLDANSIRNYFHLEKLESIVIDKQFPRDNQPAVDISDIPSVVLEPLNNYVLNLPGYNKAKKGKQVSQVLEQHGFITMQLVRVFSSLADTYGHIVRSNLAEVDFKDVVLNRRILVVLLPALEKSTDELASLGKVIVASLKAMMASGLGSTLEGSHADVIERKPTTSPSPYVCILDEYGYYSVEGFAVVPAQARSLGFSAIFAGQDLPAFQKNSKEEAASIGANTNIKICMKLEDPQETFEFFQKTAGESYVTKVDSFQMKDSSVAGSYMDTRSASFEKRSRIDLLDLKDQSEGMAHLMFKSTIIRANMFYANPKPVKAYRVNQLLKVEPPTDGMVNELASSDQAISNIIASGFAVDGTLDSGVADLVKYLDARKDEDIIEASVQVLMAFDSERVVAQQAYDQETQQIAPVNSITLFGIGDELQEADSQPLLHPGHVRQGLESVEAIMNQSESSDIAQDLVEELGKGTTYDNHYVGMVFVEQLTNSLDALINQRS